MVENPLIQSLSLDGTWKIHWTDGQRGRQEHAEREEIDPARYTDAQVPGEVHLEAMKQGWIADPYVEHNVLSARWVEEMIWSYRRHFHVPAEALKGQSWLVFEGLDLVATILLNGEKIGGHRNSFYPCRLDVTGKLREGENLLTVHLDSGIFDVGDKPDAGYSHSMDSRLHKRHWLRKPQCEFSWDWSPRLINVGIAGSVRLEWTVDETARVDQLVPLVTLSEDLARGHVTARLFVEGLSDKNIQGVLTGTIVETGQSVTTPVEIKTGLHAVEAALEVENPRLWWPVGHGSPDRYTLKVSLSVGGKIVAERSARIGFRHVEVDQSAHPVSGSYFIVRVNGRPIFCKGGNFVPADMIVSRTDRKRYERLIELALESNFNFLRVWGGGQYETDDFYELCDEKGLLVWQEFIYACGKYPMIDHEFQEDAKREAVYQIRRLASHPSLVIWCGNNEMELATWRWPGYQVGTMQPDYAFFHLVLPRLLAQEDPTRYYQPSSPMSPGCNDPDLDDRGDQHPWKVGFVDTDFRKYRRMISRFPNEGGLLGPTALPTMLACLGSGQQFVQSFDWQTHDNSVNSWSNPSSVDLMTTQWVGKNCREMTIEQYTYWQGLIQGEALREYVDNFHRRMFDSGAAIFWMYNDCWPAVRSWTTVDYYLRRTPAYHPVRRAMEMVAVVVAEEADEVIIFGINEKREPVTGELRYGVFELAGGMPIDEKATVTLPPGASTAIARFPKARWSDPSKSMAFALLSQDGRLIARNRLFLPLLKDLAWAKPDLNVRVENGQAIFTSSSFVWGVCLDLDGEAPLPDNFFDVYPGIPYALPWTDQTPPRVLYMGNFV